MIDPANKNIQRYVDSGDYFRDSVDWYCSKYVTPISQRIYMMIIVVFSIISAFTMFQLFFEDLVVKRYPIVLDSEDSVKYFPVIKAISEFKEPINISVARYLAGHYVRMREEYKYVDAIGEKGKAADQMIQGMSSRRVYREYADYMSPKTNADSPFVVYKNYVQKLISITNVELLGGYFLPDKAIVKYQVTEKHNDNDVKSNWIAEISFSMLDLEKKDSEGKSTLSFTITSYQTYKLN